MADYNMGFMAINNLKLPKEQPTQTNNKGGLLARNVRQQTAPVDQDPTQRVASYVAQIRKARMELKNG